MEWGDEWGELWGDKVSTIENHVELAQDELIQRFKESLIINQILEIHADRTQALDNFICSISPDMLFRIDSAYGVNLDTIGVILALPRGGFDDVTYRIHLSVQALIALPGRRRTMVGLLEMLRTLLNDATRGITFSEEYPKSFTVEVEDLTLDEAKIFAFFISKARPSTYNGAFITSASDGFVFDDASATVVVTGEGFSDASLTIDVGGPFASLFPLD